jgi:hypothetical protein
MNSAGWVEQVRLNFDLLLRRSPRECGVEKSAEKGPRLSEKLEKDTSGAEEAAEKGRRESEKPENHISGAEAQAHSADFIPGINPRPTAQTSFSAACEAPADFADFIPGINPRPTARTSFSATN